MIKRLFIHDSKQIKFDFNKNVIGLPWYSGSKKVSNIIASQSSLAITTLNNKILIYITTDKNTI